MFLKSKVFRVVSLLVLTLSLAVFAFADTIRLKDGSIIKGKIVSFGSGQFVIVVGEGARQRQLNFFADEIESISFTSSAVTTTDVANTNVSPKPEVIKTSPTYTKTRDGKNTIIKVGSAPKTTGQETITAKTAPVKNNKIAVYFLIPSRSRSASKRKFWLTTPQMAGQIRAGLFAKDKRFVSSATEKFRSEMADILRQMESARFPIRKN